MSVSIHVVGFRPPDEKWKQMKAIYEACDKAGIEIPDEVESFFGGENPKDKPGQDVDLDQILKDWEDEYRQGYELDVTKLPKDLRFIRFYMSC